MCLNKWDIPLGRVEIAPLYCCGGRIRYFDREQLDVWMYQQRNKESNVSTPEIQATKADGRIDESAVLAIYSSIDSACLQDIAKALQDRGEEMAAISKQFTIFLKKYVYVFI